MHSKGSRFPCINKATGGDVQQGRGAGHVWQGRNPHPFCTPHQLLSSCCGLICTAWYMAIHLGEGGTALHALPPAQEACWMRKLISRLVPLVNPHNTNSSVGLGHPRISEFEMTSSVIQSHGLNAQPWVCSLLHLRCMLGLHFLGKKGHCQSSPQREYDLLPCIGVSELTSVCPRPYTAISDSPLPQEV